MRRLRHRYQSLEDYLIANRLTVDGVLDDGWGAAFPVKGREIDATVLFADISGFSARTVDLDPVETLTFVQNFFAWITAEALGRAPGIVDKYIGDEVMIVYSREFGSKDPFLDAVQAARWMGEHDALSFSPHIGIASGPVVVGYVGTPLKYSCSVFGAPVAIAARLAGTVPDSEEVFSTWMSFPASEWNGRDLEEVLPVRKWRDPDGVERDDIQKWELLEPRSVPVKNLAPIEIRQIIDRSMHLPTQSAEQRAREAVRYLRGELSPEELGPRRQPLLDGEV